MSSQFNGQKQQRRTSVARPTSCAPAITSSGLPRARPLLVGTPETSKTPKLLHTFSQLRPFVPGMPLNGRSSLKVRNFLEVYALFGCQLIRDVLYPPSRMLELPI